jgi:glutathione S-transferase
MPFSKAHGYTPKHPDVLALNPKGQVPVLVDGDRRALRFDAHPRVSRGALPRAAALSARHRGTGALPATRGRPPDEILFPVVWELIDEVFYGPDAGGRNVERIAGAKASISAHCERLDHALAGRDFLCGQFTVADIAYFLTLMFATSLGVPPEPTHRQLAAWSTR